MSARDASTHNSNNFAAPSGTAERMRRHRERRRKGCHCLHIELLAEDVISLVNAGLLNSDMCNDHNAILMAVYELLERLIDTVRPTPRATLGDA